MMALVNALLYLILMTFIMVFVFVIIILAVVIVKYVKLMTEDNDDERKSEF